jgi:2'-5' RNA ligase
MKRTFIAVKIIPEDNMLSILQHLKECLAGGKIKWIEPDILHITLFFLGDTDDKLIPVITEKLQQLSHEFPPFDLEFREVGLFRNIRDPRIIWIGTRENQTFRMLQSGIENELAGLGFKIEKREFKPHLTVGRIKWIGDISALEEVLKLYKNHEVQQSGIDKIIFYESILKPFGPEYIPIAKIPLGG